MKDKDGIVQTSTYRTVTRRSIQVHGQERNKSHCIFYLIYPLTAIRRIAYKIAHRPPNVKHLNSSDLEQIVEWIGVFNSCHDPERLREQIAQGVMTLIGGEYASFEHFAPTVPRAWAVGANGYAYEDWVLLEFSKYASEHPAVRQYQETGDMSAIKISDFVGVRTWHKTNLYQRIHRILGIEDQMGISLGPPTEEFYSVVLSRGRRNFTERERSIMNCLRPHIASAHNNAMAMDRLLHAHKKNQEAQEWLSQTAILLDGDGRIDHFPTKARQWLFDLFNVRVKNNQLPDELLSWVKQNINLSNPGNTHDTEPVLPVIKEAEGRRLILRFRTDLSNKKFAIVMEMQTVPDKEMAKQLGLTLRQLEVLVEVEKGKSNEDIASALFISPQTVRTHLQNIFEILGVTNRTAAVARLRLLLGNS